MPIPFKRHTFPNGLRLLVHQDFTSQLAACNVLYRVGSRDEDPQQTGLAHLMEHFMFCGSKHIPNYDNPLQKVGGINNAYTSQDHTQYYITLPAGNLETALWLESDRMLELAFDPVGLDTQKQVVIEEFKEVSLNRPFGDLWSGFSNFVYLKYPYKWMPIGKKISHIESVTMDIVRDFYRRYYQPANAILVVGGPVRFEEVVPLVEKWFGSIPSRKAPRKDFPREPQQRAGRTRTVHRNAPYPMLLKGWKMPPRLHPDFCAFDLLSDMLGNAQSSYLYRELVTGKGLFTDISMTVSGTDGPGILALVARPTDGVDIHEANRQLEELLYNNFQFGPDFAHNLQKVKNKNESTLLNNEIKLDSRTSILAVEESISRVEDFQEDIQKYRNVTEEQILKIFHQTVNPQCDNTYFYLCK